MYTSIRSMSGFLILMILLCQLIGCDSRCYKHKDCDTCTQHKTWSRGTCRWCPLDRSCHAKWSPKNHCQKRHNLRHHSQCPAERIYGHYDPKEAYKLALFSAKAYSDEPQVCLPAIFPNEDYTMDTIIIKNCDDYLFEYEKQCLAITSVSASRKEIIIAFRGSRGVKQVLDQMLSLMGSPKVASIVGGKVQSYFNHVKNKLYGSVKHAVVHLLKKYPDYNVKLTGHSLGGAVASLTSAIMVRDNIVKSNKVALYTFGMPRVGNKDYAESHDRLVSNSWRVVQNGDMVARLPICSLATCSLFNGPYHHRTKVLYTDNNMTVNSRYVICNGNEDSKSRCNENSRRSKRGVFDGVMNAHKVYFGIPIGTYCRDHVLKNN